MVSLIISLNRNWYNGFNVREVWLFLIRELTNVRAELWHLHPDSVVSTPPTAIDTIFSTSRSKNENKTDVKSSLSMNKNRGEELLLCMNRDEWYLHCDTILKANAATNVCEFVELLSARVLMMQSTKAMLQNKSCIDESICTSGDDQIHVDDTLDVAATDSVPVPVPMSSTNPAWATVFCPRYDSRQPPSTEDLNLARIQMSTIFPSQKRSTEHLLSTYHTGGNTKFLPFLHQLSVALTRHILHTFNYNHRF